MEQGTPPAWHPDPWGVTELRWWDGTEWTGHTHGETPTPQPQPAPAPAPAGAGPSLSVIAWLAGGAALIVVLITGAVLLSDDSDDGGSELSAATPEQALLADAEAKAFARTAQTAMETLATDRDGSYEGATVEGLVAIEPSLTDVALTVEGSADGYTVSAGSDSTGNQFTIARGSTGETVLTCTVAGTGACPDSGDWSETG